MQAGCRPSHAPTLDQSVLVQTRLAWAINGRDGDLSRLTGGHCLIGGNQVSAAAWLWMKRVCRGSSYRSWPARTPATAVSAGPICPRLSRQHHQAIRRVDEDHWMEQGKSGACLVEYTTGKYYSHVNPR